MIQVIIASALFAAAFAAGPPAYGAPAPYHPAPVYKEEKLPPQPFAYEYGVVDDYSKNNFQKTETQDAEGKVAGSFKIALPDGRIQTTTKHYQNDKQVPLKSPIISTTRASTMVTTIRNISLQV